MQDDALGRRPQRQVKKKRKLPTPEGLAWAALRYLERFAASEASLRRVLQNRLRRACLDDASFAADTARQAALTEAIEQIIAQHKKTGVINDASFAEMKVRSLRRGGASARRIVQKLGQKGVTTALISKALTDHAAEVDDEVDDRAEANAAHVLARKRCLGPYRKPGRWPSDPSARQALTRKDYAALARAGFSYDVIADVLGRGAGTADELADMLADENV